MQVTIAGNGAWGKSLYSVVSQNLDRVSFWDRSSLIDADTIILAVPTQAIRAVFPYIKAKKGQIIVNAAKGIEDTTHKLPFQIVEELTSDPDYFSLMGPGFSAEVIDKVPTLVNLGYREKQNAKRVQALFETDYFRIRLTASLEAIELAGAFKNIYAIACGISAGIGFGANTRAYLVTIAIEEFKSLCGKLGYKIDKNAVAGCIGDLVLSCNSIESRNFTFGKLITRFSIKESLKKINATVEGAVTVRSLPYFVKNVNISLSVAEFIEQTLSKDKPETVRDNFLNLIKNL